MAKLVAVGVAGALVYALHLEIIALVFVLAVGIPYFLWGKW